MHCLFSKKQQPTHIGLFLSDMKSQDRIYATQTFRLVQLSTLEEVAVDPVLETVETAGFNLVLYNDEHNTFDHVIEMLVSVCGHDATQAEQCALLVHFKGKCTVLSGTYDELEPKCTKLLDADLTAEIEA